MVAALVWGLTFIVFTTRANLFRSLSVLHIEANPIARGISSSNVETGESMEIMLKAIKEAGLDPAPLKRVNRAFFSVEGTMVALANDNMLVFEYPDEHLQLIEVSTFQQSAQTPKGSWKKDVNLYMRDNLVVFYMGDRRKITSALEKVMGQRVAL